MPHQQGSKLFNARWEVIPRRRLSYLASQFITKQRDSVITDGRRMVQVEHLLNISQKVALCEHAAANPDLSQRRLGEWCAVKFKLTRPLQQSTVSRILAKEVHYRTASKTNPKATKTRAVRHEVLDRALMNWILQCQQNRIALTGEMIQLKGRALTATMELENSVKFSNGWLDSFKSRHNLHQFKNHGEAGSAAEVLEIDLENLRRKIQQYSPNDRFNMDETGLFYRMAPDKTIAQRQISGVKKDKQRVTVALLTNQTGSDRDVLIIGKANKPRCFQNKTAEQLGFWYRNNKKAWMTGLIFQDFVKRLDSRVDHAVLLLVDGGPHGMGDYKPRYVEVLVLPPNTTSKLQPLDAGIIQCFKAHYRRRQLSYALEAIDDNLSPYQVDQLQAMRWIRTAWSEVSDNTVVHCWQHTGITTAPMYEFNIIDDPVVNDLALQLQQLPLIDAMSLDFLLNFPDEQIDNTEMLSDEQLIEVSTSVDHDIEDEQESPPPDPVLEAPLQQQITDTRRTIRRVEASGLAETEITLRGLRNMLKAMRQQQEQEQKTSQQQQQITNFFR